MPKPSKTSASSGMKKKQAAKKAGADAADGAGPDVKHKPQRGQKGISKADKKKLKNGPKQYVAPPKPPQPVLPDPLDALGLARTLPAELVVSLRRLGKKDGVTRRKALEELFQDWVMQVTRESQVEEERALERELKELALVDAVPVWLYHLPSLMLSPSHRGLTLQIHSSLLSNSTLRAAILNTLALDLLPGTHQARDILGSWLTAALEEGKRGAGKSGSNGMAAWDSCITWDPVPAEGSEGLVDGKLAIAPRLDELTEYLRLSILSPAELDEEIHPVPVLIDVIQAEKFQKNSKVSGKRPQGPPRTTTAIQTETPDSEDGASARGAEMLTAYRYTGVQGLIYVLENIPPDRDLPGTITDLLDTSQIWDMLHPYKPAGGLSSSPLVRRAMWALIGCLIKTRLSSITGSLEELIGRAVLSSAFKEKDGSVWLGSNVAEPLAAVLTNFKGIWLLGTQESGSRSELPALPAQADAAKEEKVESEHDSADSESESSEDEEEDASSNTESPQIAADQADRVAIEGTKLSLGQRAYKDFLAFLQRGCNGNPMEGYPIVLLIIASIPEKILLNSEGAITELFSSFWAPYYAKSLYTTPTPIGHSSVFAFLSGIMDAASLLVSRASKNMERDRPGTMATESWQVEEFVRIWRDGIQATACRPFRANRSLHGERSTEPVQLAEHFGRHLQRLRGIDSKGSSEVEQQLRKSILVGTGPEGHPVGSTSRSTFLSRAIYLIQALSAGSAEFESHILVDVTLAVSSRLAARFGDRSDLVVDDALDLALLARLLDKEATVSIPTDSVSTEVDSAIAACCAQIADLPVQQMTELLARYLAWKPDPATWSAMSPGIAQNLLNNAGARAFEFTYTLSVELRLALTYSEGWQEILLCACQVSLDDPSAGAAAALTRAMLDTNESLATSETLDHALALLSTSLLAVSHEALVRADSISWERVNHLITLIGPYLLNHTDTALTSECQRVSFPALFRIAFLSGDSGASAIPIWRAVATGALSSRDKSALSTLVMDDVLDSIMDTEVRNHPHAMVQALQNLSVDDQVYRRVVNDLTETLQQQQPNWLRSSGALDVALDVLAPVPSESASGSRSPGTDAEGRTRNGRITEALVAALSNARNLLRESATTLLQVALLSCLIKEARLVDSDPLTLWMTTISAGYGESMGHEIDVLVSYAISPSMQEADVKWHSLAIASLSSSTPVVEPLQELLRSLSAEVEQSGIHQRSLRDILQAVVKGTGDVLVTERWLASAQAFADKRPALAKVVFAACAPLLSENPRLDRIRSDIASRLTGVSLSAANSLGARYLGMLQSLVPSSSSVDSFLPQQRGIFLIRHLNGWLVSDDEESQALSEEVENRIILTYREMCPVIQDVSGAHWDVTFDLIGTNLEGLDLNDPATYELGLNTLGLLSTVSDLSNWNKALAKLWTARTEHVRLVQRAIAGLSARTPLVFRLRAILNLCLEILGTASHGNELRERVVEDNMFNLLGYPYHALQLFALQAIRREIAARTTALVIELEAGNFAEHVADVPPSIPIGIMELLERTEGESGDSIDSAQAFAWTLLFDCFQGASAGLRAGYIDQLREARVIEHVLIPMVILAMRSLLGSRQEDSPVAFDEFYVELFTPQDTFSTDVLVLHIFYRALFETPVLIRNWLEACKDKQLTNFFRAAVLKYFSPVIIDREFSILRTSEAISKLQDENLTVKVVSGAAEVTVTYVIDEVPMEIVLRLPPEFPLKGVEIRDVQRVGVSEAKWRGWLFNVQQMITSRPGLLLDALTLYKGNISAHFEGKEECAICYSIISTVDRKLPKKACPTCHQIFHDSCLFQWFKSSNSSSCPLCRSIF